MWNKRLALECSVRGWKNLNINPRITSEESVIPIFRNPNPWDHHLWPATTIGTIIEELERLYDESKKPKGSYNWKSNLIE